MHLGLVQGFVVFIRKHILYVGFNPSPDGIGALYWSRCDVLWSLHFYQIVLLDVGLHGQNIPVVIKLSSTPNNTYSIEGGLIKLYYYIVRERFGQVNNEKYTCLMSNIYIDWSYTIIGDSFVMENLLRARAEGLCRCGQSFLVTVPVLVHRPDQTDGRNSRNACNKCLRELQRQSLPSDQNGECRHEQTRGRDESEFFYTG